MEKHIRFELTRVYEASLKDQLHIFSLALQTSMAIPVVPADPDNWNEAFSLLSDLLKTLLKKEPVVILFDEFPCLCTPKSGFLQAFGHWWITWASRHPLMKVVICGSAASWIIRNIINDRGGLHNRVTKRIRLLPFTLAETEHFFSPSRRKVRPVSNSATLYGDGRRTAIFKANKKRGKCRAVC